MSAGDGGAPDGEDSRILPRWIIALGSASVALGGTQYRLRDDPVQFVEAAVLSLIGGFFADVIGRIIGLTELLFDTIITGLETAFSPVLDPFSFLGSSILNLVGIYESIFVDLSLAAGPLSPLVFVLAMVSTVVIGFAGMRATASAYLLVRSAIL